MNKEDINALTAYWHRETNYVNGKVEEAFKTAQDHAYALGVARGKEDANARYEPRPPLSDDRIVKIAESMPDGMLGFAKGWGWIQFVRAVEADHGIGVGELNDYQ